MKSLAAAAMTTVVATHEPGLAREVGDQVVVMDAGVADQPGNPSTVL